MGADGSKIRSLEAQCANLNQNISQITAEKKIQEQGISQLKEKLQYTENNLQEKDMNIMEMKHDLEAAEEERYRLEREITERKFQQQMTKRDADEAQARLQEKKQKIENLKKDLVDAQKLANDMEQEKNQYAIEAARMEMKAEMMEERVKEQKTLFLEYKKRDEQTMELMSKILERVSILAEGAGRFSCPQIASSSNQEQLETRRRMNRNRKNNLLRTISIVFFRKDRASVHAQCQLQTEEDDLDVIMDEIFEAHTVLTDAIRIRSRQTSLQALQCAGYSIQVLDPDNQQWVEIQRFDDVMEFTKHHPDITQIPTFYIVHDDEKESRLEEVNDHSS